MTEEEKRLEEAKNGQSNWRHFGPYLSERQWGTVREDYSSKGMAWEYLSHDHARSRAYRWGEDGIAGVSDEKQYLCFALALWNGKDPILKERLFGLTSQEGNHGEDVKEYYFYLDNTPTHSYMKYLYKYPQATFPYADLVDVNRQRTREDFEYELLDTKIFDEDRYYDVFVEYAKASAEDLLIKISITNRGPEKQTLHLLPNLWFRNIWSWEHCETKPRMANDSSSKDFQRVKASHPFLGDRWFYCEPSNTLLFTENETNKKRLFNVSNDSLYVKDAFHEYLIKREKEAINREGVGTKMAAHQTLEIESEATVVVKFRLSSDSNLQTPFGVDFEGIFLKRLQEADAFYQRITPYAIPEEMRSIQRQAFAGLLWNKQFYHYNVERWLNGDPLQPPPPEERKKGRNHTWWNLDASHIFSMPDKWEFPWFAAWDLAFHAVALAMIDPDFAKNQLLTLVKEWYMHPDSQIPAYEWDFGDVNPPVHAWAALRIYQIESEIYGTKDRDFLERMFQKLALNFTWWVNRKDVDGRNIFEGGFLGLDNIDVFNRTLGPPMGGILEQPDATGWMATYSLNLLQIALELALKDPVYEEMATKFFEHFVYIADAINKITNKPEGLWDDKRGFYDGLIITKEKVKIEIKTETMIGVIPIFAVATHHFKMMNRFPDYRKRFEWFIKNRPQFFNDFVDLSRLNLDDPILISLTNSEKLKRILRTVLSEDNFFSPFGIRSVSRIYANHPYTVELGRKKFKFEYEPRESTSGIYGGNSNWRGPIWFPLNFFFIESLQKFHYALGDNFKVECPTGSGNYSSLWDVSIEMSNRLIKIFLKDEKGLRPLYGGIKKFQTDPHWKDHILFYEYFNGDDGAGLGASHQTGWTGVLALLIHQYGQYVVAKEKPKMIERSEIGYV